MNPIYDVLGTSGSGIASPFLCTREVLVEATIRLFLKKNAIVIRAPPDTGKSTLLKLIGSKIQRSIPILNPIHIKWPDVTVQSRVTFKDNGLQKWKMLLEFCKQEQVEDDQAEQSRSVFLIDDAHNSFGDKDMWETLFNRTNIGGGLGFFVLACDYGPADGYYRLEHDPPHAYVNPERRIELPELLLSPVEAKQVIDKWARSYRSPIRVNPESIETLISQTGGHVGMLTKVLKYIVRYGLDCVSTSSSATQD